MEVLVKLYQINPTKLTKQQRDSARLYIEDLATKKLNYPKDIQTIIDYLHNCNQIQNSSRKTNLTFNEDSHFSDADKLEIIHNLTIQDYVANTKSINAHHLDNDLIIFEPFVEIPSDNHMTDGTEKERIQIYVKLDLTDTTENREIIAYVSFHTLGQNTTL